MTARQRKSQAKRRRHEERVQSRTFHEEVTAELDDALGPMFTAREILLLGLALGVMELGLALWMGWL